MENIVSSDQLVFGTELLISVYLHIVLVSGPQEQVQIFFSCKKFLVLNNTLYLWYNLEKSFWK